jgi:hypothetical protein
MKCHSGYQGPSPRFNFEMPTVVKFVRIDIIDRVLYYMDTIFEEDVEFVFKSLAIAEQGEEHILSKGFQASVKEESCSVIVVNRRIRAGLKWQTPKICRIS